MAGSAAAAEAETVVEGWEEGLAAAGWAAEGSVAAVRAAVDLVAEG